MEIIACDPSINTMDQTKAVKKKQNKHSSENRVDPNQSTLENMLIHVPYESISLHTQHWHYFKIIRFLFNYTFFQNYIQIRHPFGFI